MAVSRDLAAAILRSIGKATTADSSRLSDPQQAQPSSPLAPSGGTHAASRPSSAGRPWVERAELRIAEQERDLLQIVGGLFEVAARELETHACDEVPIQNIVFLEPALKSAYAQSELRR